MAQCYIGKEKEAQERWNTPPFLSEQRLTSLPVSFMTLPARTDVLKTPSFSRLEIQQLGFQGQQQREKNF